MLSSTKYAKAHTNLLACLEADGIILDADTLNKAENNDAGTLRDIGLRYERELKNYERALGWFSLATIQNNPGVIDSIAIMYHFKREYLKALWFYTQAAYLYPDGRERKKVLDEIGYMFLHGLGIKADKYRALEWFTMHGKQGKRVNKLKAEGIQLKEEDKNKTMLQLVQETSDFVKEEAIIREEVHEEIGRLKSLHRKELGQRHLEIQKLKGDLQEKQQQIDEFEENEKESNNNLDKKLADKEEIITLLKREIEASKRTSDIVDMLIQSKNNEIELLKANNQMLIRSEQESRETIQALKRKLGEKHQDPLTETTNDTHNTESSNQCPHISNVDDIRIKTEEEEYKPCQIGNKKRKVTTE